MKASFVIPTLNTARWLEPCLASVRAQDFPTTDYEVLVADGGSTDGTVDVARRFGATVLDCRGLMAEASKQEGFRRSTGEYLVLLDADNEIASRDWLRRALAALDQHPDALGFESYYLKHPSQSRLNRYLTGCLQISDPLARAMSARPRLVEVRNGVEVFELPADGRYPTGANGYIFSRRFLSALEQGGVGYHEASFFPELMRQGHRKMLKIPGLGVHHHYLDTWRDFYVKRRRAMIIYCLRREETGQTWDAPSGRGRTALLALYHGTLLGPGLESVARAIAARDPDWLLHGPASVVSVFGTAAGMVDYRRRKSREARTAATKALHDRMSRNAPKPPRPADAAGRNRE